MKLSSWNSYVQCGGCIIKGSIKDTRPMLRNGDISLALNTFETFQHGDGIVPMRSVRRKIAKIGVISPSWRKYGCAFFRSENSKRSKEIKLCIVYAYIHTHPNSAIPHSCRHVRTSFASAKSFRSDFEREAIHFSHGVISRTSSCCCNVLIPGCESHVTMYTYNLHSRKSCSLRGGRENSFRSFDSLLSLVFFSFTSPLISRLIGKYVEY